MTNANEWLEQNYPINGVCLIDDVCKNKGKKRSEIVRLAVHQKELTGILDLSSFPNLVELFCRENQLTNIILPSHSSLKVLNCSNNKLTKLNLSSCLSLEILYCQNNRLTSLILPKDNQASLVDNNELIFDELNHFSGGNELIKVDVSNNYLTTFNYACLNPLILRELRIQNNNLAATDLQIFTSFINLACLSIGNYDYWIKINSGNQFTGSLESFQNLTKLEVLDIQNLNMSADFQYLPSSLQRLECNGQMREELALYGNNLQLWQAYHPRLMQVANKEVIKLTDLNFQLKKQIRTPFKRISKSAGTINYHQQFQYNSFFLRDPHLFSWEWGTFENNIIFGEYNSKNKNLLKNDSIVNLSGKFQNQLPLRLYNLATKKVINSKNLSHLNNYLTLSYCWGIDWENNSQSYGQNYLTDLTKLGRKALNKAHATYHFLKKESFNFPNYIWIDNFCINQTNKEEKEQEVSKQKNYYSNSMLTLIAIDKELEWLKFMQDELELTKQIIWKIIDSPWFHRSWTFQEGLLSKQTIFMFDDCLIDGRRLALYWGGTLSSYNQLSHAFITPLGWSYHNETTQISYNRFNLLNKTVNLTLGEALHAISHREQTILLDSIYSILGLLPYGEKVIVDYQETNNYTTKDLENKLTELINQVYLYNPKEIMTYWGERNPTNWWLPKINENNSFNISSSLNYDERAYQYFISQIKNIAKQGIQLRGHYTLLNDGTKIIELDSCDHKNKANWDLTIQFALNKNKQLIAIKEVREWHYPVSQNGHPKELFIDMLNYEVISKLAQPEKYHKLFYYQHLLSYLKGKTIIQLDEFKHFLNLVSLDLINLNLTESLDLSIFINLEVLECSNNKITGLILPLASNELNLIEFNHFIINKLKVININACYLTSFNYMCLNLATLTKLNISDNNLPTTNINFFSHLINLETLWIGSGNAERIQQNIYNRFFGSLESWKNLTKLKAIEISNTDLNAGVEYLPSSITEIHYSTKERPTCQLTQIEQKITEWLEKRQLTNNLTEIEETVEDWEISY